MKIFSVFLLFIALILTAIGLLPFMNAYPYSGVPNSGPTSTWELLLIISFEGRPWFIISGIVTLIISMYFLFKGKKIIITN